MARFLADEPLPLASQEVGVPSRGETGKLRPVDPAPSLSRAGIEAASKVFLTAFRKTEKRTKKFSELTETERDLLAKVLRETIGAYMRIASRT